MSNLMGKLWAAPVSLVGLLLALAVLPFGARLQRGHNALQVLNFPFGNGALTLGNVVLKGGARIDGGGALVATAGAGAGKRSNGAAGGGMKPAKKPKTGV